MAQLTGVVGVGLLGGAIAERLLRRGHSLCVFDIDSQRREQARQLGAGVAANASEVARRCDVLLLSLPTDAVVNQVLQEIEAALRPGQLLIDTTTGEPDTMAEFGARLANLGVSYVDATIAGSSELARRGEVVAFVGGPQPAYDAAVPLLLEFAKQCLHVGPHGAGATMKLVHNLVLGLHRAVLAEGLNFAAALGLDRQQVLAVLRETPAYSRVMDLKGDKMVRRDFTPQALLSQHLKDVRIILGEGERHGAWLPLSQLHADLLTRVEQAGFGGEDNSAIVRAFENPPSR